MLPDDGPTTPPETNLGEQISPDWLQIGKYSYYGSNVTFGVWTPNEKIIIGKFCSISDKVAILTGGEHRTDFASTYPLDLAAARVDPAETKNFSRTYRTTRDTTIGNDVWIGLGAMVLGGVHVGDGAVIGSGAVVHSDVRPYAVVAGNPAVVLRYRFSKQVIERLLRIAWWNWPEDFLLSNLEWFYKPIAEFVDRFDPR